VHCGAESHLDGFQIQGAAPLPLGEDPVQQRGYFAGDLPVDTSAIFFLWCECLLHRPCAADLFVDCEYCAAQFPEASRKR
jgi:hypothetical protein